MDLVVPRHDRSRRPAAIRGSRPTEIFSATNPTGIRCTLQDLNRNEFGIDPRTGYARRPLDNVGVQYGLKALNAGTITVDQFLDLNGTIGGYDINGQPVAEPRDRTTAADFRRAYATGRVLSGGGGMRDMPIITVNLYSDPYGDIHDRFRLFTIRERLRSKDGKIDRNEKIWTRPSNGDIAAALTGNAFDPGRRGRTARHVADQRQAAGGGGRQLHRRDRRAGERRRTSTTSPVRAATSTRCSATPAPRPARRSSTTG